MKNEKLTLIVKDLHTHFFTKAGIVKAVNGVSFQVGAGKILGIVGESGSGKSITGLSILGLLDPPGKIVGGEVLFHGKNLIRQKNKDLRKLRGKQISMIFQDAMMTLNPVLRIETQMVEAVRCHTKISRNEAVKRCLKALKKVGIPAPEERIRAYPHEFSGGMRQRVAIATAMLNEPELIIADEPTTALDVTIQAQIIYETQRLCKENNTSLIWITHDLSVIAGLADSVCVMYAGRIIEQGMVDDILDTPLHPYTKGLIGSVPSRNRRGRPLSQIPGTTPSLLNLPSGCAFRKRCPRADAKCKKIPESTMPYPGHSVICFHPHLESNI